MKIRETFLNLLYPRTCPVCRAVLYPEETVCDSCRETLVRIRPPVCVCCGRSVETWEARCEACRKNPPVFDGGFSVFAYEDRMKRSLYGFKEQGRREYAAYFGEEMARALKMRLPVWKIDLIVPVPIHPKDRRRRGFHPAGLLAEEVGRAAGLRTEEAVVKVRWTRKQKELNRREREKNLRDAFVSRPMNAETVLVIDDVFTTGSTLNAMTACLKEAGAGRVYFLTLCRAVL